MMAISRRLPVGAGGRPTGGLPSPSPARPTARPTARARAGSFLRHTSERPEDWGVARGGRGRGRASVGAGRAIWSDDHQSPNAQTGPQRPRECGPPGAKWLRIETQRIASWRRFRSPQPARGALPAASSAQRGQVISYREKTRAQFALCAVPVCRLVVQLMLDTMRNHFAVVNKKSEITSRHLIPNQKPLGSTRTLRLAVRCTLSTAQHRVPSPRD